MLHQNECGLTGFVTLMTMRKNPKRRASSVDGNLPIHMENLLLYGPHLMTISVERKHSKLKSIQLNDTP
jgi:hypothetical protein